MPTTTRLGLPYPDYTDPADVPTWMEDLAVDLDGLIGSDAQGAIGTRPAPGVAGRYYTTTNEGLQPITYRDDGTAWRRLGANPLRVTGGSTALPANPADGDCVVYVPTFGGMTPAFPVSWLLRYSEASTRWEFCGGSEALFRSNGAINVTALLPSLMSMGPGFYMPRAGVFDIEWGMGAFAQGPGGTAGYGQSFLKIGGVNSGQTLQIQMGGSTTFGSNFVQEYQGEVLQGVTVDMAGGTFASNNFQTVDRYIKIKPVYLYKVSGAP